MRKNFKREKWISRISLVTIALACQNAVYADDVPSSSTVASSIIQQEGRTISGTITDEQGNSIPGANILIKGTSIGTISDMNGNFELQVPAGQHTIEMRFDPTSLHVTEGIAYGALALLVIGIIVAVLIAKRKYVMA